MEFWKKYTRKERLQKKLEQYLHQKETHYKRICFLSWKDDTFAELFAAKEKVKQFISTKLLTKYFLVLYAYKNKKLISRHQSGRAYLHLQHKLLAKYFKGLRYATFERGKRKM